MAKQRTKERRIKRAYTSLAKHEKQSSTRISRHAAENGISRTILTRKGKLEKLIMNLEKKMK